MPDREIPSIEQAVPVQPDWVNEINRNSTLTRILKSTASTCVLVGISGMMLSTYIENDQLIAFNSALITAGGAFYISATVTFHRTRNLAMQHRIFGFIPGERKIQLDRLAAFEERNP